MLNCKDYNYQTKIGCLEVKMGIAIVGLNTISKTIKELGEKYSITEEELSELKNAIWDLQSHLQQE